MRRILGRCAAPGCTKRAAHDHHVVYAQEIERRGGDPDDSRWLMPLCMDCHFGHHNPGVRDCRKLPLTSLPDAAIEAAFELMGPFAMDYLRRRYRGEDPRVLIETEAV